MYVLRVEDFRVHDILRCNAFQIGHRQIIKNLPPSAGRSLLLVSRYPENLEDC